MPPCLPCQPAEDLRKGGFPRAVLPRYGGHAALWNGQRNILKNSFSANSFREPCCLQDGRAFVQYGGSGRAHSLARRAQTHAQDVCFRQKEQILRCILGLYSAVPQIQKSVCDPHQPVDPMLRDEQGKALLLELPEGLLKLLRPGGIEVGRRLIAHKDL